MATKARNYRSKSHGNTFRVPQASGIKHKKKKSTNTTRGRSRMAISTAPNISGSGRVDMLTHPVAIARAAAVATGASGYWHTACTLYVEVWD